MPKPIHINTYKFFGSYGFAWRIGKAWGNYTPVCLRFIAMIIHKLNGDKKVIIINKK